MEFGKLGPRSPIIEGESAGRAFRPKTTRRARKYLRDRSAFFVRHPAEPAMSYAEDIPDSRACFQHPTRVEQRIEPARRVLFQLSGRGGEKRRCATGVVGVRARWGILPLLRNGFDRDQSRRTGN